VKLAGRKGGAVMWVSLRHRLVDICRSHLRPAVPRSFATLSVGDLPRIRTDFLDSIGNTPLIRLQEASDATGCEILGKAEFLNPGGSVKDRAAKYLISDAEKSGKLKPDGIVVEGTAGNTGIGLALVANARGYKTVIVIPETQSQEKKDMLRICGAELVEVPAVPYKNPNNYVKYSSRLAQSLSEAWPAGAVWANQFDNTANRRAHYDTTGPEIWAQTEKQVDAFVCAVGTGGTLAGVGRYLKDQNPNIKVGLADPMGAALWNYYEHGELKSEGESISEGIGQGRITDNLKGWGEPARDGGCVDWQCQVHDDEAMRVVIALLRQEGLMMGTSTGINVAGAIKMAKWLGPGHTIVTILCDYGIRYQGKIYNVNFLKSKGLPYPDWLDPSHKGLVVPNVMLDVSE